MYTFILYLLLVTNLNVNFTKDENTAIWERGFDKEIVWHHITSLGKYVVVTEDKMLSLDPETGDVIWESEKFGNLEKNQFQDIASLPLLKITVDGNVYLLDQYSGNILFNSSQLNMDKVVNQMIHFETNGLLVVGKQGLDSEKLAMLSLADGSIKWEFSKDLNKIITIRSLSNNEILVVTIFDVYKIDAETGEVIWENNVDKASKKIKKAFGGLLSKAIDKAAENQDIPEPRYVENKKKNSFYLINQTISEDDDNVSYETDIYYFDLKTGERIWEKPFYLGEKVDGLYSSESGLIVLGKRIHLIDYETKEGLWGKKGRGLKIKGYGYKYIKDQNDNLIIVSSRSGKSFIYYLNLKEGKLKFGEEPIKVKGNLIYTKLINEQSLAYVSNEEFGLLNLKKWKKYVYNDNIETNGNLIKQNKNVVYLYDLDKKNIKYLDIRTKKIKPLTEKIKFDGKEVPQNLEITENGLLLQSPQNYYMTDFKGGTIYNNYYKAPRESGFVRALSFLESARMSYISAEASLSSAQMYQARDELEEENPGISNLADTLGTEFDEMSNEAAGYSKKYMENATSRYKATTNLKNFAIVATKLERKAFGLIKMNKKTGEVEKTISFGKDREPTYQVDLVSGTVFYLDDNSKVIKAYEI